MRKNSLIIGALIISMGGVGGCSGLWEPSHEETQQLIASIPPGHSGSEMYALLDHKGFSPQYENCRSLKGYRSYQLCMCYDECYVTVELNDAGNIVESKVSFQQNFP